MNEKLEAAASDFKHRDAASYDDVTDAFERHTQRFTGAIAERVVELAALGPDEKVLDVGSGTGVVSFAAARRLTGSGRLVGIDLSDGMLRAAREKAARLPEGARISFRKMDAEALELADGEFDCALSLFALRHFPRPEAALAEIRRVLRPGGRALIAVGSPPPLASREGVAAAWRRVGSLVAGAMGRGDLIACAYLDRLVESHLPAERAAEEAEWIHHHAMHGSVQAMMGGAGFTGIRTAWAGNEGVVSSVDEFWDVQVTFSTLARKRLAAAPREALDRLRREFDAGCARTLAAGGRLRYPTGALIVMGTAPMRS